MKINCETCRRKGIDETKAIYDVVNDIYSCSQACKDQYHRQEVK
jgi:hypothetical protein